VVSREPLDDQTRALVERIESDPAAFREAATLDDLGFRAAAGPSLKAVSDLLLPGDPPIPARVYLPDNAPPPRPALLWLHPGGFTGGSIDDVDANCRVLAAQSASVVMSIDYRLAPTHRYPAAALDVRRAMRWLTANCATFGVDPQRIAVGGQSAGATLAATFCLEAGDGQAPALQVLCYPILDPGTEGDSYRENAAGYVFTAAGVAEDWSEYLGADAGNPPAPAAPLLAPDLSGVPPALILAAGYDPARDDSRRYAQRLASAGREVTLLEYGRTIHAFLSFTGVLDVAQEALAAIATELRARLGSAPPRLQHATIPYRSGAGEQVREFYRDVLGLSEKQVPRQLGGRDFIWFDAGPYSAELHLVPEDAPVQDGLRHLCLAVDRLEPLEQRLADAGYELERHELMPGRPQLFVRDPFLNLVEITVIPD
jgi:acetyl esterase